ncbi:MAG: CaiB/BaiF CoA transferase family protein [Gammaproteobacteria bacterium]
MLKLLAGYRVLESSQLLNGASTAAMLADLGADVIKVESPFLGDYLRVEYTMHLHRQANKSKRSVAIDLRKPQGRDLFLRLLATADVFVTNAIANRNEKLGLSYAQLREHKPDIVYCQNTGFGASGPYREVPTHGQMMNAIAGSYPMELDAEGFTQPRADLLTRPGSYMGGGEATAVAATSAAFHIAAALAHRERTGEGCYIDISAAEAVISSAWISAVAHMNIPETIGHHQSPENLRAVARYQFYQAADGRFLLFCPEEKKFWETFCDLVGRPELKGIQFGVELRREIQAILKTRTLAEWMQIAVQHKLPIGPAHIDIADIRADPQIAARGIFVDGRDETGAPFTYVGQPAQLAGQQFEVSRPAPRLGEHTDEILRGIGCSDADLARYAAEHVTTSPEFVTDHIAQNVFNTHKG